MTQRGDDCAVSVGPGTPGYAPGNQIKRPAGGSLKLITGLASSSLIFVSGAARKDLEDFIASDGNNRACRI
jgi:hypothetical protein